MLASGNEPMVASGKCMPGVRGCARNEQGIFQWEHERRDLLSAKIAVSEFSANFDDVSRFLSVIRRFLTSFDRNRALINPLLLDK